MKSFRNRARGDEPLYFDCPSCDGKGMVEDPHHGHAFRCERCGGKKKFETCKGYGLTAGQWCIRKKDHGYHCFSVEDDGRGYFIEDDNPPTFNKAFVDDEYDWPDDIPKGNYHYYVWGQPGTDRRAAIAATKEKENNG